MKSYWTKGYIILIAVNFCAFLNFHAGLAVTSSYAIEAFGSTQSAAGFAVGIFVIGGITARFIFARFSNQIGTGKILMITLIGMAVLTALYPFANNYVIFCFLRLLEGLCFGFASNAAVTEVTGTIPPEKRGQGVGYFMLSAVIGIAMGPFIAINISMQSNWKAVFWFMAIVPAIGAVLLLMIRDEIGSFSSPRKVQTTENEKETDNNPIKGIDQYLERRALPIALVCWLIYNSFSAVTSFVALYASHIGASWAASYIFLTYSICIIVTRPFFAILFDRRGANTVIVPGIIIFTAGILTLSLSASGPTIVFSGVLIGVGLGAVQIGTLAAVTGLVPIKRISVATATYFISLDASSLTGPVIAGFLITCAGYNNMYLAFSILAAVCLPLYIIVYGRKAKKI